MRFSFKTLFERLICNHLWLHHWVHMPDKALELRTCTKCGTSEMIKIVKH